MSAWMVAWYPRVTIHSLAITVSVLTYILTTRVERERRPPSIAIAWVLGLIAVPYLVLPLYLMFGRRKLLRKPSAAIVMPRQNAHWAEQLLASFGLAPSDPAQTRFHGDGAESRAALFEIISNARRQLDISTYILADDQFGREAMDRMMERARSGVRVRLLIDGVGAMQLPRACFKRLHTAGVETAIFSPLLARSTSGPRNLRNHRKLTIADGALLWAGGRNLAAEYFCGTGKMPPWRDLTFDVDGGAARAAALQFEADWLASRGKASAQNAALHADAGNGSSAVGQGGSDGAPGGGGSASGGARAQFLPSGPDQSEDTVHALLIDACFHAGDRLLAVTPYFVPDAALETALRLAARRGVKIDLCLPAKSNHHLADFARSRSLRSLAGAGVKVHLLPYMVHAKAVVFDRSLALCGSANLDSRSLLLNYECAVVFYDQRQIDWLAGWISDLLPDARRFDGRAPGLLRDVCEGLLLTVAYQL
jgi:cardiolipin synthase